MIVSSVVKTARSARRRGGRLETRTLIKHTFRCLALIGTCTGRCSPSATTASPNIPLVLSGGVGGAGLRHTAIRRMCSRVGTSLSRTTPGLPRGPILGTCHTSGPIKCKVLTHVCLCVKSCGGTLRGTIVSLRGGSALVDLFPCGMISHSGCVNEVSIPSKSRGPRGVCVHLTP